MEQLVLFPCNSVEVKSKRKKIIERKYKHSEKEQIVFLDGFEIKKEVRQLELNFFNKEDKTRTYKLRTLEEVYSGDVNLDLTPEQFKRLNKIINGIAAKRNGWLQMPKEEVIGELWIKSLEVILRCNQFNPSVIARSCWNKLNDVCRLGKRTREKVILSSEWMEKIETEDEVDGQSLSIEDDNTSKLYIEEMLELFPKDSNECLYLKALMFQIGLDDYLDKEDIEYIREFEDNLMIKNNNLRQRRETKIAKLLGFTSESAVGYRTIRDSVRKVLVEKGYKILKEQ